MTTPRPSGRGAVAEDTDSYRWVILAVATLTQTGTAFLLLGVGALAGFIQDGFGLSGTETGLLVTAVGLAPVGALLPTGRLLDKGTERWAIAGGALLMGAGAALAASSRSYPVVLAALFVGGAGYASSQPGGSKVVAAWFPPYQRGLAMGVRQTGLPLGGALAAAALPAIADRSGWEAALFVAAAVSAACGLVFAALYRRRDSEPVPKPAPFLAEMGGLLRRPFVGVSMLAGVGMVGIQFALISYLMLYLRDVHGVPLSRGAWMLFGAQAGGVAGRVALAAWSDHLRSRLTPVSIAAGSAGAGAALLAVLEAGPSHVLLIVLSCAVGFFAFGWYGPWVVFVAESAPRRSVGLTLALAITANQVGLAAAPPLFGLLLDLTGTYAVPWLSMALLLGVVSVRTALHARRDRR